MDTTALRTEIQGRVVENEDLVNLPNWLSLTFRIEHDEWFDLRAVTIRSYRQELDLRRGVLSTAMDIEDAQGRRTALVERRFVSMSDMHLGALELAVTAENWSGRMTIRSAIDGRVVNAGAKLYREFNNRHLRPIDSDVIGEDGVLLRVRTSQSDVRIAQAAVTRAYLDEQLIDAPRTVASERGYIAQQFTVELRQDETLKIEKLAFLYTSQDFAISECGVAARKAVSRAERFDVVLARHVHAWANLWRRFDIRLQPAGREFRLNLPMLLRLNMFHLLQAASLNSIGLDIGVPARGWTGEAYQGHVFWDELFIFPALNYRAPEADALTPYISLSAAQAKRAQPRREQDCAAPCFRGKAAATDRRKRRS